jgi:hypothetical protein
VKKWAMKVAMSRKMGADLEKRNDREHDYRSSHLGRRFVSLAYMMKGDAANTFDEKPNFGEYN